MKARPETNTILLSHAILSLNFNEGLDISKPQSYAALFKKFGVDQNQFGADLTNGKLYAETERQFADAREIYGAEAFPAIIYGREGQYFPLCQGYQDYDNLAQALETLHKEPPPLQ